MDYKEKYEKAYKLLEQIHDGGVVSKTDIENTFPELKTKSVIDMLKIAIANTAWLDCDKNKCLSWIEKQGDYNRLIEEMKERKELISKEKDKATSTNDKLSLGGRIAILEELLAFTKEKQGEQNSADSYCQENCKGFQETGKCYADGECKAKRDAEQKSAWSNDDEETLTRIVFSFEEEMFPSKQECRKNIDFLHSLKNRVQQKQEWKQENTDDLTDFENAMMHIGGSFFGEYAGLDPNDTNAIKEQAKLLLELAPKQEWSEDDEDAIGMAIEALEDLYDVDDPAASFVGHNLSFDEAVQRLKCLKPQPHWKPTDEQLMALRDAIDNNEMESLYNDLKKL